MGHRRTLPPHLSHHSSEPRSAAAGTKRVGRGLAILGAGALTLSTAAVLTVAAPQRPVAPLVEIAPAAAEPVEASQPGLGDSRRFVQPHPAGSLPYPARLSATPARPAGDAAAPRVGGASPMMLAANTAGDANSPPPTAIADASGEPQPTEPAAVAQADDDAAAEATDTESTAEPGRQEAVIEEDPAADADEPVGVVGRADVTVIGAAEAVRDLPGSGFYLDTGDIRTQSYDDVNRVLRRVPGVYLREEDGLGLFPNISLRGTDPGRSSKVSYMEDGVLIAPAPYSAPAVYNNAATGRMHAIEVLKGSSQIRFGPHITGGALNYISTPLPTEQTGYIRSQYGSNHDVRTHAYFGDRIETDDHGNFSYLVEGFVRRTDGFKNIDTTPDFRDGDRTGFTRVEPMLKLAWEPPTDTYHQFEAKVGYTTMEADETYLGLSTEDFRRDPFRRYSSSRIDNIDTEHWRTYLRHYMEPTEAFDLTTTVYYNDFAREWYKLHALQDVELDDNTTTDMGLSPALAGAEGGQGLEALRGERRARLQVRSNNREYYSLGVGTQARYRFETGDVDHEITAGVRFHYDEEFRFQHEDLYQQEADGTISGVDFGAPGSQAHRRSATDAVAFFIQDEIDFGRLTVTPGFRFEHLWQRYREFDSANEGSGTLSLLGGGVGATYDLTEQWQAFGGVHRGFSPPGPRAAIRDNLKEETSIATEGGLRFDLPERAFGAEAAGFFTYFDDLISTANVGAGGDVVGAENVGRVNIYGAELAFDYDPGVDFDLGVGVPTWLAFTYTNAELRSNTMSLDAENIFSGGRKGNRMPYIPEFTIGFGTGLEIDRFGVFVSGYWVDEMFTTASNTRQEMDPDGNPDARFGTTDSHVVVDLSAQYRLTEQASLFGGVHNLFNEKYIASRHPHGPRPGAERFLYVGMEVEF